MAALPQDFLTKLVAEVAELKGIVDSQKNVKETDPTVKACAGIAYTQIMKHTKVPWHKGERIVYFDDYYQPLLLPTNPVHLPPEPQTDPATNVITITIDGEAVAEADWAIKRGRLVLYEDEKEDPSDVRYRFIELTATTGLEKCEDHHTLYTAMQIQTIGNYHRRDTYGLAETTGEKGVARQPADSGQVLESVAQMLEDVMYLGQGYYVGGE
jgi:hypothetical protein